MNRESKIIKLSVLGIIVNLVLVAFKAVVGFLTNSIAIILDAVNNLSDALSSIITIIGTKLSTKRPDKKHPYGYGRIEYFSSIIIAMIVLFAGITAFKESFDKIINPSDANYSIVSLIIIIVAVIIKFMFGKYIKSEGEKLNSTSLIASGTDATLDSVLSFSTFVAAIISYLWQISLEGYLGIIIALIIIKSAIEILKDTINDMIGIRADTDLTRKLRKRINSFDQVKGTYDLVLHNYGPNNTMATAHIEVADNMTAKEIHHLTKMIALAIYNEYGINLTLGIYASNDSGIFAGIKGYLMELIKNYPSIMQVHGFYVDEENKYISFDLIFDFAEKDYEKIKDAIITKLKEKYSDYDYFVVLDTDFSD